MGTVGSCVQGQVQGRLRIFRGHSAGAQVLLPKRRALADLQVHVRGHGEQERDRLSLATDKSNHYLQRPERLGPDG